MQRPLAFHHHDRARVRGHRVARATVSEQVGAHHRRVSARRRHWISSRARSARNCPTRSASRSSSTIVRGASGLLGTELAAKAAPDGYTIFMGTLGNLSVNPLLFPKAPFDVTRDFAPLTQAVAVTFMLYVHPSVPGENRQGPDRACEIATRANQLRLERQRRRAASRRRTFQFAGRRENGARIAYKGSGPSFIDVLGGQVPLTMDSLTQGLPYVKSGRLRRGRNAGPQAHAGAAGRADGGRIAERL